MVIVVEVHQRVRRAERSFSKFRSPLRQTAQHCLDRRRRFQGFRARSRHSKMETEGWRSASRVKEMWKPPLQGILLHSISVEAFRGFRQNSSLSFALSTVGPNDVERGSLLIVLSTRLYSVQPLYPIVTDDPFTQETEQKILILTTASKRACGRVSPFSRASTNWYQK